VVLRGRHRPETSLILRDLHTAWAWIVIVGNGLAGLWALAAHPTPALRRPALWWFTAAAQVSIFVQVGLGVWLVAGEGRQIDDLHMFYGFIAIVAVGIIYSYRQQLKARLYLLYGFGGLFLMGLAIRALVVDAGG
jgi:hypothetical protein